MGHSVIGAARFAVCCCHCRPPAAVAALPSKQLPPPLPPPPPLLLLLLLLPRLPPVAQVWPTLDPIVCELVRSSIEPLLDDMKPPIIAKMGFQRLTLGVSELSCRVRV